MPGYRYGQLVDLLSLPDDILFIVFDVLASEGHHRQNRDVICIRVTYKALLVILGPAFVNNLGSGTLHSKSPLWNRLHDEERLYLHATNLIFDNCYLGLPRTVFYRNYILDTLRKFVNLRTVSISVILTEGPKRLQ
jgi:hypothetical protein